MTHLLQHPYTDDELQSRMPVPRLVLSSRRPLAASSFLFRPAGVDFPGRNALAVADADMLGKVERGIGREVLFVTEMGEHVVEDGGQFDVIHVGHWRHGGPPAIAGQAVQVRVYEVFAPARRGEKPRGVARIPSTKWENRHHS